MKKYTHFQDEIYGQSSLKPFLIQMAIALGVVLVGLWLIN